MIVTPSPMDGNGDGRDRASGRFAKGWRGGKGNPHARQVARLRSTLLRAVTPTALKAAVNALLREAQSGNVAAIRELLDRTLGKPVEADLIERLERLEAIQTEQAQ